MNKSELKDKIKALVKGVYQSKAKSDDAALPYDELTNFPELKTVIVNLLTSDFDKFLESIDWIAPRPSTFRINLLNGQSFVLIYGRGTWIATVEGKNYDLINLDEELRAAKSISRILSYGAEKNRGDDDEDLDFESEAAGGGGGSSSVGTSGSSSTGVSKSEWESGLEGADTEGSEDIEDVDTADTSDDIDDI